MSLSESGRVKIERRALTKQDLVNALKTIPVDAEAMNDKLLEWRRHLHENPEPSDEEVETVRFNLILRCPQRSNLPRQTKYILQELLAMGVDAKDIQQGEAAIGVATGCVVDVCGTAGDGGALATILIRSDIDALRMQDECGAEYQSKRAGVAHTCGHDTHAATLLGAVRLLLARRASFSGRVRCVFQPAEETTGGAARMIKAGVADAVDAAISLHVMTANAVNTIAVKDGPISASEDEIHVTIRGEGGHASAPHLATNPVACACAIVSAIPGFLVRTVDPMRNVVFTVSTIQCGSAAAVNVIAETCTFAGTLRTLNEKTRGKIKKRLPAFIQSMAAAFNAEAEIEVKEGYCAGSNAKSITDVVRKVTQRMYGNEALVEIQDAELGAEDFFCFDHDRNGRFIPAVQFWLGGANEELGLTYDNHHPQFNVDERCLAQGAAVYAGVALSFLREGTRIEEITKRKNVKQLDSGRFGK